MEIALTLVLNSRPRKNVPLVPIFWNHPQEDSNKHSLQTQSLNLRDLCNLKQVTFDDVVFCTMWILVSLEGQQARCRKLVWMLIDLSHPTSIQQAQNLFRFSPCSHSALSAGKKGDNYLVIITLTAVVSGSCWRRVVIASYHPLTFSNSSLKAW